MPHRRTSLPLVLLLLVVLTAASIGAGWLVAASMADRAGTTTAAASDPAEPTYDAGDPSADAPIAPAPPSAPPDAAAAAAPPAVAPQAAPVTTAGAAPPAAPSLTVPPADAAPAPVRARVSERTSRVRPERARARVDAATAPASTAADGTATETTTVPAATPETTPEPTPDPTPSPEPKPEPEPAPKPKPEPKPEPKPQPAPKPRPRPRAPEPIPTLQPYDPPPAIGIAATALPPEGRSWTVLTAARRRAPSGSQARADLDWLIAFARSAANDNAPDGRRATAQRALRVNAWWYARRPAPGERVIARDPDGVILTYKRGHGFMVNPVATVGRWRDLNDLWSAQQLAASMLPMLARRNDDGIPWSALEYFDVPGEPEIVRPGVSAMAQARAATLFAKAWAQSRDPTYLDAAQRVLASFRVPVDDGGVLGQVRDPAGGQPGPWYPERAYPGEDGWKGAALNGFMVTLIELDRAARVLATDPSGAATAAMASDVADRGRASLVRFLPIHDSGSWSYYGLLTPGKPWRTYLADLNYHCYHVALLRSLAAQHPEDGFDEVAQRWQGYVDARGATCPAR